MVTLYVQHQVRDFNTWKKAFDAHSATRQASGQLSEKIYQDEKDQNNVVVLFDWQSIEQAQQFGQSQDLQRAMKEASVVNQPTIKYLRQS